MLGIYFLVNALVELQAVGFGGVFPEIAFARLLTLGGKILTDCSEFDFFCKVAECIVLGEKGGCGGGKRGGYYGKSQGKLH
jgi:hypothetical protein